MTTRPDLPNEHEFDRATRREGRNTTIVLVVALLAILGLFAWQYDTNTKLDTVLSQRDASIEQFEFCKKDQNADTNFCAKPVVSVGPEGPIGPRGLRGLLGIPGQDGEDGRAGVDGRDGADGERGPVGPVGAAGADGADGADGTNGTNGTDGTDGAPGPACPDGFSPQTRTVTTVENGPEESSVCIRD